MAQPLAERRQHRLLIVGQRTSQNSDKRAGLLSPSTGEHRHYGGAENKSDEVPLLHASSIQQRFFLGRASQRESTTLAPLASGRHPEGFATSHPGEVPLDSEALKGHRAT